jgi:hypothetical protein
MKIFSNTTLAKFTKHYNHKNLAYFYIGFNATGCLANPLKFDNKK